MLIQRNTRIRNLPTGILSGLIFYFISLLIACDNTAADHNSAELINEKKIQETLFQNLTRLTNGAIRENEINDSIAFLVLPLEASCPSCRKKTIDSIIKHKDNLPDRHFIILSVAGGEKTIRSFFQEQNEEVPVIANKLFLDTTLQALKYKLFKDNPVIFYAANRKTYKKVAAIPATIRKDLQEFFSGSHFGS